MKQRLWLNVECDNGILYSLLAPFSLPFPTKINLPERLGIGSKLRASDNLTVALHLFLNLALLHLCGFSQSLLQGLLREAVLIDAFDGFADELKVFHYQQGVAGQELQDRLFLFYGCELGHDVHAVAAFLRQLVLHLEGADGVDVVAKEVDAEWEFVAIGIDVEDGAAQGKLTRLIDIIDLAETKVAQRLADAVHSDVLILRE